MVRFRNFQAYLEHASQLEEVRSEFVTEHEEGLIYIDPSFLGAVWRYLGHTPDHMLGKGLPLPEILKLARELKTKRAEGI